MSTKLPTKLRKGDTVRIMVGRSKGMQGKIESIDHNKYRVIVAGANILKRHTKPSQANPDGGILDKPQSIHLSNVMFVDPKADKATRLGYRAVDGKKGRYAKASGQTL